MSYDAQPDNGTVSEGVLDLDSAAHLIADDDEPRADATETPAVEAETVEETEEIEATQAEDATDATSATEAEETEDGQEAEGEALEPIQAPHSWDAEAGEVFAKLPREAQEIVVARENERDRVTSQKLNESANQRKQAEQEASQFAQYRANLDQLLVQGQKTFGDRWASFDWQQAAQHLDPKDYQIAQANFAGDQKQLAEIQNAQQQTELVEHQQFLQHEGQLLAQVAPELADPVTGPERRAKVATFLKDVGVPAEDMKWATAEQLSLAHDAMRYRELKAHQSAPTTAATSTKPAAKSVKPTTSQAATPRKAKTRAQAMSKLTQSGSVEDAAAAIMALED